MKILLLLLLVVSCSKSKESPTVTEQVAVDILSLNSEEFEKSLNNKNLKALGVEVVSESDVLKLTICKDFKDANKTKAFLEKIQKIFTNPRIESVVMGEYRVSKAHLLGAIGQMEGREITCLEPQSIIVLN